MSQLARIKWYFITLCLLSKKNFKILSGKLRPARVRAEEHLLSYWHISHSLRTSTSSYSLCISSSFSFWLNFSYSHFHLSFSSLFLLWNISTSTTSQQHLQHTIHKFPSFFSVVFLLIFSCSSSDHMQHIIYRAAAEATTKNDEKKRKPDYHNHNTVSSHVSR